MILQTRDFGEIEVEDKEIIKFEEGLPGFKNENEFVLLPLGEDSPFIIMQSVNTKELAFVTIEPKNIINNYEFHISDKTGDQLKIKSIEDVILLNIANVKEKIKDMTINLAAPLVININQKLGKQIILDNTKFPVKFKFQNNEKQEKEEVMG